MKNYMTEGLDNNQVSDNDTAVKLLHDKIDLAKSFAIKKHGDQKYGTYPYEVHLNNVVNVLLRNNILPTTTDTIDLWIGAWLHDVLEDTNATKEELVDIFGIAVYEMVNSLTDGEFGDRKEKKEVMYQKLILNQNGIIIKLADRIANLEFSIINNNSKKIKLYVDENSDLNKHLNNVITDERGLVLLKYLNGLVDKIVLFS
ncbi:bifunctional (p)ppGpp synthetase/guanosine-3',5'-bis(diphosphate) 3'-pyrophosphohydrolase [Flavobacterium hercynium]|nr:bifunctional (p)ppGpp synthetase/guanosine-3',5'-bis(diphosphate) 3'-pyrophosphohydrolase [Flavobacterium hercynium]SMP32632.1 HD domain-containing protein [Flavobacterium hercynium]